MILEYTVGQRFRTTALRGFKQMHPCFMGIGIGCMIVSIYFCLYYIVIITWCVYYFFISLTKDLPWIRDKLCPKAGMFASLQGNQSYYEDLLTNTTVNSSEYFSLKTQRDLYKSQVENFTDCCVRDPSMWYFYSSTLQVSTDIDDYGEGVNAKLFGCLLLAWFLTYICIAKGIKTSGKVRTFCDRLNVVEINCCSLHSIFTSMKTLQHCHNPDRDTVVEVLYLKNEQECFIRFKATSAQLE
jgi:hypothetical protein